MPENMNQLVDSHCHLNSIPLDDFNQDLKEVLDKAQEAGVEHFLTVCVELEEYPELQKIAATYPQVSISVGSHPNAEVSSCISVDILCTLAEKPACIAIGETGLDFYRTTEQEAQEIQKENFRAHIQAALQTSKPLIVHTRQAAEATIQILTEERAQDIGGVMHCFSEDLNIAKKAMDLNFYISFSGILTFKNAKDLQEVAKKIPLEKILIETDSPYLAPVPFRGKQNHPANVQYVAKALSILRNVDYSLIARQTTENFYRCFKMK
jgi:TatD DNase family protein